MIRISYILLLLTLLFSCKQNNKPNIELKDLVFADYERKYIAENNIDSTILISHDYSIRLGYSDTLGYITYDSTGRLVIDRSDGYSPYEFRYDSIGLKTYIYWRDWDVYHYLNSTHVYNQDSLVLYAYWTYGQNKPAFTYRYKFNDKGLLIEEIRPSSNIQYKEKIRALRYDNTNTLISEHITEGDFEIQKEFFYSNKIDSVVHNIKEIKHVTDTLIYKMVDHYDSNGLKQKTIKQDSLTIYYFHFKKKMKQ